MPPSYVVPMPGIRIVELDPSNRDVSVGADGVYRLNVCEPKECDGSLCHGRSILYRETFMAYDNEVDNSVDICDTCFADPEAARLCLGLPMTRAVSNSMFCPRLDETNDECVECKSHVHPDQYYFLIYDGPCNTKMACSCECMQIQGVLDPMSVNDKQRYPVRCFSRGGQHEVKISRHIIHAYSNANRQAAIDDAMQQRRIEEQLEGIRLDECS